MESMSIQSNTIALTLNTPIDFAFSTRVRVHDNWPPEIQREQTIHKPTNTNVDLFCLLCLRP